MLFGYDITYTQVIGYLVLAYILIDTVLFLINGYKNTGNGGCATDDWVTGPFLLNSTNKPASCPSDVVTPGVNALGKWKSYALKDEDGNYLPHLYESQVDKIIEDIKDNYVVEGYTPIELFAYIIVPVITVESIGFWLLSTRASKAEWTFWILVITLVYTGLTTLVKETADIDITPPKQTSCLSYLTDGMGFTTGDELQYTFMGRKQDGTNCMIEGTYLGTPDGGIEPDGQPTIYRGDAPKCSATDLPLY